MRQFSRELRDASPALIRDVALALVRRGTAEGRQVGYELLARRRDAMALLTPALVRRLGRGNDNWESVDGFAAFVTGEAWRAGLVSDAEVAGWARSKNDWWRRTALASTVTLNLKSRGGDGDPRRTLLVCRQFTRDTSPMLAKALSWALRSLVPHDKDSVRRFIATHHATLPAIVKREVGTKIATGKKTG
jgi:3-methyladenine DNA glycosylase AlkD